MFGVTNTINAAFRVIREEEERFRCPENFDKIKDLKGGLELWAGANDWEVGWTWAAIYPKGTDGRKQRLTPKKWLKVDHSKCVCGGHSDTSDCKERDTKECRDTAERQVLDWAKEV